MNDFQGKKRGGRPKVLNKAAKIVLKRLDTNKGDSTRKLSHSLQAKSRKGHEKLFKMFKKLEAPKMAKKTAAWLAQLGERRSAEREVAGSNPGRTNTLGL